MKFKMIAVLSLLIWPLLSAPGYAERLPRAGSADERVKTITYHENDVYRLKGHYGFTTTIAEHSLTCSSSNIITSADITF